LNFQRLLDIANRGQPQPNSRKFGRGMFGRGMKNEKAERRQGNQVSGMGKGDRRVISLPIIPLTMIPLTNFVEND
jgi:hypothetical protein